MMISFIVPIFYKKENSYIVKRIYSLIEKFKSMENVELIIADASRFNCIKSNKNNIVIVDIEYKKGIFSPALVRNKAVSYAKGKYLFFFDVDLDFNKLFLNNLFIEINNKLVNENNKFLMFPCMYLSKNGSLLGEKSNNNIQFFNKLINSVMLGENIYVDRLAISTSAIILEKKYFIEIGMFNTDFHGHGGEDFELLHRLASFSPHSKREKDYYLDKVEQFPSNYKGFRKYLAYYSLPYLFTNLILIHNWHERPLFDSFYMKRTKNEKILVEKMELHDNNCESDIWDSKIPIQDYNNFIIKLMNNNGYAIEKYPGLFKYAKNTIVKSNSISKKIRKLITRPKMFFNDIKIVRYFKKLLSF